MNKNYNSKEIYQILDNAIKHFDELSVTLLIDKMIDSEQFFLKVVNKYHSNLSKSDKLNNGGFIKEYSLNIENILSHITIIGEVDSLFKYLKGLPMNDIMNIRTGVRTFKLYDTNSSRNLINSKGEVDLPNGFRLIPEENSFNSYSLMKGEVIFLQNLNTKVVSNMIMDLNVAVKIKTSRIKSSRDRAIH